HRRSADLLHQHVRGGCQQHAQLIGKEPRATRAVERETVVELLDAVLDLTPLAVDPLVHPTRSALEVGDHEPWVVAHLPPRVLDHFGLEDHTTLAVPGPGGIAALAVLVPGLAGLFAASTHRR